MVKTAIDYAVKLLVLLIAGTFLFVYWQKRDDGRYEYHHQPNTADAEEQESIFDTRTN